MAKYSMTCTCGHVVSVEAGNREEGITKMKQTWTPEAVASHMAEKHAGEPVPSVDEVHGMIEKTIQETQ